ncbi:MAG: ABC transporter permease [Bacteroidetes bacterium]|uniref:ABC transporter permease n=1 Tax=Candidatus Merdivivens pullistercoris TaxID=2840873 RepID=A0A9D9I5H6_9BACT|nr:ABC transporter permease [Candidatus Merdivivens pullistercoris]
MNWKKIGVIIGREYAMRVKKKSFLVITFITPVLMGLLMVLPTLIMLYGTSEEKGQSVAVSDGSGIVFPYLESDEHVTFSNCSGEDEEYLKKHLDSLGYKALVTISPMDSSKSVAVASFSYKPLGTDISDRVRDAVDEAVEDYRVRSYNIEGLADMISSINYSSSITSYTISEDGSEKLTVTGVYRAVAIIFSILIYIFVYSFGGMVMSAVINEKTSRVVEVMVSSVKAIDLMIGKILGIAAVALTQFFLWIVLTLAIVVGVNAFIGMDELLGSPENAEQIMEMAGGQADMMGDVMAASANSEMEAVISTISQINFPLVIGSFLLFFIFGYLLYSSMFAAIGSAVDNEADTNQLLIPVTIPILAAFFIAFASIDNPESPLLLWASYIPFTSPICMMMRIVNGIPSWEIWASLAILIVTTFLMMYLSAKIYKVGILMFGKKSSFKDMWKWLKYK